MKREMFTILKEENSQRFWIYGSQFVNNVKNEGKILIWEVSNRCSRFTLQPRITHVRSFSSTRTSATDFGSYYNSKCSSVTDLGSVCERFIFSLIKTWCFTSLRSIWDYETTIKSPIFLRPPGIIRFEKFGLYKINRKLYGILEARLHSHIPYHRYHKEYLDMKQSIYDRWLIYTEKSIDINDGK